MRPLKFLSGGQKSRVAFAKLAWSKPHVVVMDEPTNHLDLETIEGLIVALQVFAPPQPIEVAYVLSPLSRLIRSCSSGGN